MLLWFFVFAALRVVRSDLYAASGMRVPVPDLRRKKEKKPRGSKSPQQLLVTHGALAGTRIALDGRPILIGRADDSTLVLDDDYASTRHARICPSAVSDWYVEDLGSTNGTYLDRAKVTAPLRVPLGVPDPHRQDGDRAAPMTLVLRYAARSDRGLVRSNNQDSVYAGPRLLALADGMGGHAAGEVASKVVIAALAPLDDDEPCDDLLARCARRSCERQRRDRRARPRATRTSTGMGTTLTAVLFAGSRLAWCHVGDSRAYLLRDGQFAQITRDDTLRADADRRGPDHRRRRPAVHPQRSLLLRALTGHEVEPSLTMREARAGDRYLLCSDGLSGVVSDETLAEAMQIPDPQAVRRPDDRAGAQGRRPGQRHRDRRRRRRRRLRRGRADRGRRRRATAATSSTRPTRAARGPAR